MTLYEFLVIVHVLAAAVWIGAGVIMTVSIARLALADTDRVVALSEEVDYFGVRIFVPATVIVVIAGAWAVTEGSWDFDMTWVTIGFGVWLIGVVLGGTWHRTEGPRLRARLEASGPGSAELAALKRAMVTVGAVELALLVLAVWAMVAKPGL